MEKSGIYNNISINHQFCDDFALIRFKVFFIRHIFNYTEYNQYLNVNQVRSAQ